MLVWLEVDIGDRAEYQSKQECYSRGVAFVREAGGSRGWGQDITALDEETREIALEVYRNDPKWSTKGDVLLVQPTPLTVGRLVIELYEDSPKTLENFRCLVTGEKGKGKESGKPLHYKGSPFHRIVKGFMSQGGDITRGDGSGGESIYGKKFNDEKEGLKRRHERRGTVGMANKGKNSNSSQFYITFAPLPALDGKHVVVGQVVDGLGVLDEIERRAAADKDGEDPREHVEISDCGFEH